MREISNASKKMKNLTMEQPLTINRQDEIGGLAVNLNEMTDNL
ncbi:MAG: HAMP domain-containing protein, partial [Streptococcaceae bacterium]|nr:HAMP domain-containing protein [Streptococcaceae bacterium]